MRVSWVPSLPEVAREAIIVAAGALLAAAVIRGLPVEWRRLFQINEG